MIFTFAAARCVGQLERTGNATHDAKCAGQIAARVTFNAAFADIAPTGVAPATFQLAFRQTMVRNYRGHVFCGDW